jgi:hypothetical protein
MELCCRPDIHAADCCTCWCSRPCLVTGACMHDCDVSCAAHVGITHTRTNCQEHDEEQCEGKILVEKTNGCTEVWKRKRLSLQNRGQGVAIVVTRT